jgi:hypothetical protein
VVLLLRTSIAIAIAAANLIPVVVAIEIAIAGVVAKEIALALQLARLIMTTITRHCRSLRPLESRLGRVLRECTPLSAILPGGFVTRHRRFLRGGLWKKTTLLDSNYLDSTYVVNHLSNQLSAILLRYFSYITIEMLL